MFAGLMISLVACTNPPVFTEIGAITVILQTPGGTSKVDLEGEPLSRAVSCLYGTEVIEQVQSKQELLPEIFLIEVKDRNGDRMFELYTDENLKGDRRYYRNTCILKLIKQS